MSYVRIGRQSETVLSLCSSVFCRGAQPGKQGSCSSIPGPSVVWVWKAGSCGSSRGSFLIPAYFLFLFLSLCCCISPLVGAYSIISCARYQEGSWMQGNLGEGVEVPSTMLNVVWCVSPWASHFTSLHLNFLTCNGERITVLQSFRAVRIH